MTFVVADQAALALALTVVTMEVTKEEALPPTPPKLNLQRVSQDLPLTDSARDSARKHLKQVVKQVIWDKRLSKAVSTRGVLAHGTEQLVVSSSGTLDTSLTIV